MTEAIEAKIEKLLRVADGTANEHESSLALQMAQKLADTHNLDIGQIGKSGARRDEQVSKGLYQYQRTLYTSLAKLNHCKAWITKGLTKGSKYQTRLLGSKLNVAVTVMMADYLEEVTNRMVRERYEPNRYFSKDAHLFREGMIDRLVARVEAKRRDEEAEREQQKREQDARMRHPGAATENAIVLISDVSREEAKANYDYENGDGAWDRLEQRRTQRAGEQAAALARYEEWAAANPEEVARKLAEQEADYAKLCAKWDKETERNARAAEKRRQERIDRFGYDPQDYKREKPSKQDSRAYNEGQRVAETVNLDDQIDHQQRRKIA